MSWSGNKKHAFTLVEVLATVAIIAILAGILIPTIGSAIHKAEIARAKSEVMAIESAWKQYFLEYGKWPVDYSLLKLMGGGLPQYDADETKSKGIEMLAPVVDLLTGNAVINEPYTNGIHNPKTQSYLEIFGDSISTSTSAAFFGAFVDPWGRPYKFLLDTSYDNKIEAGPSVDTEVLKTVIVWSRGLDGIDSNITDRVDDIRSWSE